MLNKSKIAIGVATVLIVGIALALLTPFLMNGDGKSDGSELYNKTHHMFHSEEEALAWDGGDGFAVFALGGETTYEGALTCINDKPTNYESKTYLGASYAFYFIDFDQSLEEGEYDLSNAETLTVSGVTVKIITRAFNSDVDAKIYFETLGNTYRIIVYSQNDSIDYLTALDMLITTLTKAPQQYTL